MESINSKRETKINLDFIGIGAPRSGTTWLFKFLAEHPEVCGASEKETYFFDAKERYQKGLDFYKSFFSHCEGNKLKGEFTATYLANPKTPKRIKKHFPEIKLIVCLRDPAERAYSYYCYDRSRRRFDFSDFEEALNSYPAYIEEGFYYKHLKRYLKFFDKKNILILIYNDIERDSLGVIQKVYKFLNIDDNFIPKSCQKKVNTRTKSAFKIPFLTLTLAEKITLFLKRFWVGKKIIDFLKIFRINKFVNFIIKKNKTPSKINSQIDSMKPFTKSYLKSLYIEDIKRLEKLIKRDLSSWYD